MTKKIPSVGGNFVFQDGFGLVIKQFETLRQQLKPSNPISLLAYFCWDIIIRMKVGSEILVVGY